MKILLLTYPYHSVHHFGEKLADSLGYEFICDPMDISVSLTGSGWKRNDEGNMEFISEHLHPRSYIFPNAVNDDTIISHNVKWHKLPGSRTEEQFLNDWTGSFDKVIAITTNDLTGSAENYCAVEYYTNTNNSNYKRYIRENSGHFRQEIRLVTESWWDNDKLTELESAHSFLTTYVSNNSITSSVSDDFMGTDKTIQDLNNVIDSWDIPEWNSITTSSFDSGSYGHGPLLDACTNWVRSMY